MLTNVLIPRRSQVDDFIGLDVYSMDFSKDEKIVCEIKTKEVLLINYYIVILKKQIVVHLPIITFVKDGLICTAVYKLVQIVVQANDETQVYTKLV